ncbi:MAG: glutamate--tRNA ligase [Fibrobacterota bacterium]
MTVRVRFAPSPTGYLHVGGARTALFNYLYARQQGGTFILRVEDTDRSRYREDALNEIFTSLEWLGLDWDEGPQKGGDFGPYYQSERLDLYQKYARILVEKGAAYYCFCSSDRLAELREKQETDGAVSGYDRHCRGIDPAEAQKRVDAGEAHVLRLKIPDNREIRFNDVIRGEIAFSTEGLDDFVLMKTDGYPTYHMANIVDDHTMEITHVLRGDEWINSAPKHELLYEAFGWQPPVWVHLPIILAESGGKLSKRKGAASVMDYSKKGILPEALFNFLALLGWGAGDDVELMDRDELIRRFSLEAISAKGSVFDNTKLEWMNSQYLKDADPARLIDRVRRDLIEGGIESPDESLLTQAVPLLQSRCRTVREIAPMAEFLFKAPVDYPVDNKKVRKAFRKEGVADMLIEISRDFESLQPFTAESVEAYLQAYMKEHELGFGRVALPVRIAVTGVPGGPSLFEIIELLGRQAVAERLKTCSTFIRENYA